MRCSRFEPNVKNIFGTSKAGFTLHEQLNELNAHVTNGTNLWKDTQSRHDVLLHSDILQTKCHHLRNPSAIRLRYGNLRSWSAIRASRIPPDSAAQSHKKCGRR